MKRNVLWSEALHDITLLFNRSVADQYDEYHQPTDGNEHLLTHFRNERARWETCVGNTIANTEAEEMHIYVQIWSTQVLQTGKSDSKKSISTYDSFI